MFYLLYYHSGLNLFFLFNVMGIFIGAILNLYNALENVVILTILVLPIHEQELISISTGPLDFLFEIKF